MSHTHFDVIIIGGRCAGASLATRLAGHDLKILLVDRATFPGLPSVPSSPIIHPGTMTLLDEMGLAEADYTYPGGKIERYIMNAVGHFDVTMPTSQIQLERSYTFGIDRCLFDEALWNHAAGQPGVTAHEGFSVTDINIQSDPATITGHFVADKIPQTFSADLIVGADGRYSFSARRFGAETVEEENDYITASYHAEWENVEDYAPDKRHSVTMYNTNEGFMLIAIPIAHRKYYIVTYMQSEQAQFGPRRSQDAYYEGLQRVPHLWNRLRQAQRVTDVVGLRQIKNGYRQASGKNWALVGDAVHYKDPLDGQGIYDALLGAKLLAEAVLTWKTSGQPWQQAGLTYEQTLHDATHLMFRQTTGRVRQEVHTSAPEFLLKTYVRWLFNDPDYQTRFLRYLSRALPSEDFDPAPGISPGVVVRGLSRDIRSLLER
jgi:2-polyprenyl-6-methoxyphenol hydroxylase-like FAD-dependent oxidoreductase